ncbi:GAF domain-containing protein [Thermomicrobiaceae bacterium CFH 74404]|uniref:histidine kinase n=1 Tax=Thermalbibacter longus TaxID=2951981 RepID=A0AA41WDT4_9BACT|nr:GAF domain-containing protein [Thermalbibacter longus]MCM8748510.1 GAF domain-containing protein [Thermalbibacter longus]
MDASSTRQPGGRGWFHRRAPAKPAEPQPASDRRGSLLPALETMAQLLQAGDSTTELLEKLAEQARQAMEADLVVVRRFLPDQQSLLTEAVAGVAPEQLAGLRGAVVPAPPGFSEVPPGTFAMVDLAGEAPGAYLGRSDAKELAELGVKHALVLPLCARGVVAGRLEFGRRIDLPFTLEKRAIAPLIAYLLAGVLLPPAGPAEEREMAALRARAAVVEAIDPAGNLDQTLARFGEAARALTSADLVLSVRWQPEEATFVPVGVAGGAPYLIEMLKTISFQPAVVPALQLVAQQTEPVIVLSQDAAQKLGPALVQQLGARAALLAPLRDPQGRLQGALIVLATRAGVEFDQHDAVALAELVRVSGPALALAAKVEELHRQVDRLWLIERLARDLAKAEDEVAVTRHICEYLGSFLDTSACCLGVLVNGHASLTWSGWSSGRPLGPVTTGVGDDAAGRALRIQAPVRLTQREAPDPARWLPSALGLPPGQSALIVPAMANGRVVGVLALQSPAADAYRASDEELALEAARWAAHAVVRLQQLRMAREAGERRASLLGQLLARQEAERKRLVDAVHNATLQGLASCLYRVELTARRADQQPIEATVDELHHIRDLLAQQVAELREIVFRLRPATLDHLGLEAALREYLLHLKHQARVEAALDAELPERLPPELETTIYRVVQEAIDTVRLKAGITRALVRIRQRADGTVVVTIADDGKDYGVPPELAGAEEKQPIDLSLLALRERIALAGGAVRFAGLPQGGAVMQIVLPRRDDP